MKQMGGRRYGEPRPLHDVFKYQDGKLFWKISPKYDIKIGDEAGTLHKEGYWTIGYMGKSYLRHRIIYFLHTGLWPDLIDHIDTDRSNDRYENLRPLDKSLNAQNSTYSFGIVPYRGVSIDRSRNKYAVHLKLNGKRKFLGYFDTPEEGAEKYEEYKKMAVNYVR